MTLPGYDAWLEKPYRDAEPYREESRLFWCDNCEWEREGWGQWYGSIISTTCDICGKVTEEEQDEIDDGPDPDEQRDLRLGF